MRPKPIAAIALVALGLQTSMTAPVGAQDIQLQKATGLIEAVRLATSDFQELSVARAAGYVPATGCVSGPQEGAMGVHWANPALIGDGELDVDTPELLMYEEREGRAPRLVGVEYLVIAEAWHAKNSHPPILRGQHFHYVSGPNRYGLPPFYELHVWAWADNPKGPFADWNPRVSCAGYDPK